MELKTGENCVISDVASIGENVVIGHNCIIEEGVTIGNNSYIDSNVIIRRGVKLGEGAFIGANCIIGEYLMDFCRDRIYHEHPLSIGDNALIRSGSIIYAGSKIGKNFQSGHQVTIREHSEIGDNVSIGTLSDIQGNCKIGNYVRMHSNVHVGQLTVVDDFVWIYPYVCFTNDPTPPSEHFKGVHVHSFAIVATSAVIMPGLEIGQDSLVAAGALVNRSVDEYQVVAGNPARVIKDVRELKHKITGKKAYPWREYFSTYMPWEGIGFEIWYNSLDMNEKEHYTLGALE